MPPLQVPGESSSSVCIRCETRGMKKVDSDPRSSLSLRRFSAELWSLRWRVRIGTSSATVCVAPSFWWSDLWSLLARGHLYQGRSNIIYDRLMLNFPRECDQIASAFSSCLRLVATAGALCEMRNSRRIGKRGWSREPRGIAKWHPRPISIAQCPSRVSVVQNNGSSSMEIDPSGHFDISRRTENRSRMSAWFLSSPPLN